MVVCVAVSMDVVVYLSVVWILYALVLVKVWMCGYECGCRWGYGCMCECVLMCVWVWVLVWGTCGCGYGYD